MIHSYTLLGMLGWCSFEDFKRRRGTCMSGAGIWNRRACFCISLSENLSIGSLLAGCGLGVGLLLLSYLTRQIGTGDALVLMVSGIYLGFWENARLFFHGLMFCGVWSLLLLVLKRKRGKDEVAFIPFLFLAYLEMILL